jgi:hypothetical protein
VSWADADVRRDGSACLSTGIWVSAASPTSLEPPDAKSAGIVICGSSVGSNHPGMSAQIAVGLTLPAACALATNVGSILKHRGANAVPAFAVRRPLRSRRALLGSGWFACGLGLALVGLPHRRPVIALTGVTANVANIAGGICVFNDPLRRGPRALISASHSRSWSR